MINIHWKNININQIMNEEEYHFNIPSFKGMSQSQIYKEHPKPNITQSGEHIEIVTEYGTIVCEMENKICIQASLFPHLEYYGVYVQERHLTDN